VATPPKQLTLTFGEPFEPAYSNIDLLDGTGATLLDRVGSQDASDPHVMVVTLPTLADGIYTVDWRTVSAADGHNASGFFTFGVGNVAPPAAASSDASGDLHAGHGAGLVLLETESRAVGDLGFMLAFGLAIASALVLRGTSLGPAIGAALAIGALGSATLAGVGAASSGAFSVDYIVSTRTGVLLLVRIAVALLGIGAIWATRRIGRPPLAILAGGLAGLLGIGLIVLAGHASGYASPAPLVAAFVHVSSAAVWIGGLALITWIALAGSSPPAPDLRTAVPRFSALALISIGLVAVTGVYADGLLTGAPLRFDNDYAIALLVKILLVVTALTLGAFNYLDGGRTVPRFGGFRRRIAIEATLVVAILIATANLASGSPPGLEAPVGIAPAFSSATAADATLALQPGRPGPTEFIVTVPGQPAGADLDLARTDSGTGSSRVAMRPGSPTSGSGTTFVSDGGLLPAGSHWDITVIVHDAAGTETGRTRFTFAIDNVGVVEGRASPPVDLALLLAIGLLLGALLLAIFTIAGGTLPRVDPRAGRWASLAGSAVAGALGLALMLAGRS
jgi:copper transport protein